MISFGFRNTCRDFYDEFAQIAKKKETKLIVYVDVQLPDFFHTRKEDFISPLKAIYIIVLEGVIGGSVNVEILLRNSSEDQMKLCVRIMAQSDKRIGEPALKNLKKAILNVRNVAFAELSDNKFGLEYEIMLQMIDLKQVQRNRPFDRAKILLAEDNEINAMVFCSFLEGWGANCTNVTNGNDAFAMAKTHSYDLILMDIFMPQMNGKEATELIRNVGCDVPIVLLTGTTEEMDIIDCFNVGANDCLLKPASSDQLFQILAKYLLPV